MICSSYSFREGTHKFLGLGRQRTAGAKSLKGAAALAASDDAWGVRGCLESSVGTSLQRLRAASAQVKSVSSVCSLSLLPLLSLLSVFSFRGASGGRLDKVSGGPPGLPHAAGKSLHAPSALSARPASWI